jgi:acyl-CoA hydrolase
MTSTKQPGVPREQRTPSSSLVLHNHTLTASDVDSSGVLSTGFLLELVDKIAAIVANRFSGLIGSCVTASMDSISFLSPARIGDVIVLRASVNRAWGTSMEVGVLIENENVASGTRRFLSRAFLTMVGTVNGKPVPVPEVVPETPVEKQRFEDAGTRRIARMAEHRVPPPTLQLSMETSTKPPARYHPRPDGDCWQVEMVFPPDTNHSHNLFGGKILHWILNCATIAASRFAKAPVVAAGVDRVSFLTPIRTGDIVYLRSFVSRTWKTSIECYTSVSVLKFSEVDGKSVQTLVPSNDGYAVFVARDTSMNLLRVPQITTFRNPEREIRWKGGEERRQARLKQRQQMLAYARQREAEAEAEEDLIAHHKPIAAKL